MFMTDAFRIRPVDGETVNSSSLVSFEETKLWCDHIPDKSEVEAHGYWAPFAWNEMQEPSLFSEYKADVLGCKIYTSRAG